MTNKLLRKISPASVLNETGGQIPRLDQPNGPTEYFLYNVYGIASKLRTGMTDKGPWTSFKGQFEAITNDGEIFVSGQVFLPQPFEDMLMSSLQQAQQADEKASVQFAVRVFCVPPLKGKPSATGYEYRCESLIESVETSPLADLRTKVQERVKQLAAPKEPGEGEKNVTPPGRAAGRR